MRDAELKEAEAMVERLLEGNLLDLGELTETCKKRVLEITHGLTTGLKPHEAVIARRLVIETFNRLLEEGSLSLKDRENFQALAALAVRRVLVDILRRLESGNGKPEEKRIMETFRTFMTTL